jgi:hypothetical protein
MESTKTGVLYDPLTLLHGCKIYHPERQKRFEGIIKHLREKKFPEPPASIIHIETQISTLGACCNGA